MFFVPIQPMQMMDFDKTQNGNIEHKNAGNETFQDVFQKVLNNYEQLQSVSEKDGEALALGSVDDLSQVQINAFKAESALQTAVQLTSRTVSAYKEIMQMSI